MINLVGLLRFVNQLNLRMVFRIRIGIVLVFLVCFVCYNASAMPQVFTWYDTELKLRKRIDLQTKSLEWEKSPGTWVFHARLELDSSILHRLPPRIAPHSFSLGAGRTRLTLSGTGQVYELDEVKNTLTRVDQTFYAGYNFGAAVFRRKNQIYSFGGSGFWNFSKTLTYFSESKKEWENIKTNNLGPQAIFNGFQGYASEKDQFYAGGSEYHQFLNEELGKRDAGFYAFDFEKHVWSYLGDISADLLHAKNQEIFWTGRYFVQFSNPVVYLIDPMENQVYELRSAETSFQVAPLMYVGNNQLVGFWDDEGGKRTVYDIGEMVKMAKPIGQFYSRPNYALYMGLACLALAWIAFLFYSSRRKKITSDMELDDYEWKLLRALMQSSEGLSSIEVNEVLGLSTKSLDNQRKLRVQVIANMNQKFHMKYRSGNIIIRNPSLVDKRQSQYSLSPEARAICQKFI